MRNLVKLVIPTVSKVVTKNLYGGKRTGSSKDGIVFFPTHFTRIYNTSKASIIPQVVVSSSHLFSIGGFSPSVFKSPTAIEFKGEIN